MRRRDLHKRLKVLGWCMEREGGRHEIWTNGQITEAVPRHAEINELLAKKIIKIAEAYPCIWRK